MNRNKNSRVSKWVVIGSDLDRQVMTETSVVLWVLAFVEAWLAADRETVGYLCRLTKQQYRSRTLVTHWWHTV